MQIPHIDSASVSLLFSVFVVSHASIWGIKKAIALL